PVALDRGDGASTLPPDRSLFFDPPALVGRDDELAWLGRLLHDAADGHPGVVFVYGEAGIGKTRLVREFRQRARAAGFRILYGRCQEDVDLPPAPLESLLRQLGEGSDWTVADEQRGPAAALEAGKAGAARRARFQAISARALAMAREWAVALV